MSGETIYALDTIKKKYWAGNAGIGGRFELVACQMFALGWYFCWWTISSEGSYPPSIQCLGTNMAY